MTGSTNKGELSIIEFKNVTKRYGDVLANDNLCFRVVKGEIHAIVGENGAGKTTAMKLLFGLEKPTNGEILFNGLPKPWSGPKGALDHRVGMVHQHFMLSLSHSALDNVLLGNEFRSNSDNTHRHERGPLPGLGVIDRAAATQGLEALCEELGFAIPWSCLVSDLPVGVQQQLEIIKLVWAGADIMIFDEPTAVLSPLETEKFLDLLRKLAGRGKTIIVITHKLKEVKHMADRVTIMRRGRSIETRDVSDTTVQDMADRMVGRHVVSEHLPRGSFASNEMVIQIEKLSARSRASMKLLDNINLSVNSHEVVGLAGVEGSGQLELVNLLCGPLEYRRKNHIDSGWLKLFQKDAGGMSAAAFRRSPVAIIPSDRLSEAVLLQENLVENDILGHDHEFAALSFPANLILRRSEARSKLPPRLEEFDVRPCDPDRAIKSFSGGNQQKFVMARELTRRPKLIICGEPTRGVDVGSIERIHREILKFRDEGAAILLISSQLDELMSLSDRIYVMFQKSIVAEFKRGDFSENSIGRAMGGGNPS
jgi:simple sugar transport system ATP-binding protein